MKHINSSKKTALIACAFLLLAAFIWGFAFIVVKKSLDLVPATYMLAFRFSIATIALCIIFFKRLHKITRHTFFCGLILGVFLFASYLAQTVGCQYTTAGKNAFITTIYVIIVPFLHFLINHKKLSSVNLLGAMMALVGIGLLSLQGDLSINIGDLLTLLCGFLFSFHFIFIDRFNETEDPVLLTILQIGFAAVFSWAVAPIMDGPLTALEYSNELLIGMLYLGIFSTMIGFLIQNICQKYTHPATAAVLMSMESVFGVLCSVAFLHEVLTGSMIIGCILMFAAIIIVELKGAKK